MINCICIDDEPLALSLLDKFVQKVPYLNLLGKFESAFEAIELLKTQPIDLIFLDINMPDINGIQFIKTLSFPPMVIFSTAHAKYALDGFELNAVDYLLKPFAFERFLKAVDKAHSLKLLKNKQPEAEKINVNPSLSEDSKKSDLIFVKSEHQIIKIDLNDIIYVESIKDYLKIHLESQKNPILTISTLKSFEEQLDNQLFTRVHRSFIIAIKKIKSIRKGRITIGQSEIPIGDLYADNFLKRIGLNHE